MNHGNLGPLIQLKLQGGGRVGRGVDLARRGILGLRTLIDEGQETKNLPAVVPQQAAPQQASPLQQALPAPAPAQAATPQVQTSPLQALAEKAAQTPMTRRNVLKQAGQAALSRVVPKPELPIAGPAARSVVDDVTAAKEAIMESPVPKVSHLDKIQDTLKSFSSDSLFDVFHEGGVGQRLFAPGYGAYDSFLPFISKSLSPSEKEAIDEAQKLFNRYDEELDGEWFDADSELPEGIYDKVLEGAGILQKVVLQNAEKIPLSDWPMPDEMEKLHIKELKDYGHELTPEQIEDLKNTDWGQDFFYGFDGED